MAQSVEQGRSWHWIQFSELLRENFIISPDLDSYCLTYLGISFESKERLINVMSVPL
jgi:hypothetical protein